MQRVERSDASLGTRRQARHSWAGGFAALRQAIDDARARRRLKREIADLAAAGLIDGIARPLGLSPFGTRLAVRQFPGAMRRYAAMTQRLGLAERLPVATGLAELTPLHRRCLFCRASVRCERWIAAGADLAEVPHFCPNGAAFAAARD